MEVLYPLLQSTGASQNCPPCKLGQILLVAGSAWAPLHCHSFLVGMGTPRGARSHPGDRAVLDGSHPSLCPFIGVIQPLISLFYGVSLCSRGTWCSLQGARVLEGHIPPCSFPTWEWPGQLSAAQIHLQQRCGFSPAIKSQTKPHCFPFPAVEQRARGLHVE